MSVSKRLELKAEEIRARPMIAQDPFRKLAEEIVTKVLGESATAAPSALCDWAEARLRSAEGRGSEGS